MIDISQHIAIDNGWGDVKKLSDGFEILHKYKYISKEDLEIFKAMVGFRNIISHEYVKLDKQIVYHVMTEQLDDIKKFSLHRFPPVLAFSQW